MVRVRARGHTVAEVICATALAGVLISVHLGEMGRQQVDLRHMREEARARDALLAAYERLHAGMLQPSLTGEPKELEVPKGVTLTIQRIERPVGLPADPGLVAVRLRAEWRSVDKSTRWRELTTLAQIGGGQ